MSQPSLSRQQRPLVQAIAVNAALVGLMWILEALDQVTRNSLDVFGITPRSLADLGDVFLAPWLHFGWAHLASNSVPFLILGILIYLSGPGRYLITLLISIVASGLTVWLISPPLTNTAGASGVVFGFLTYVLVRGFFTKSFKEIALAIVVFLIYGGILWGALPTQTGISWQAHLGGGIGGMLAAWLMHGRQDRKCAHRAQ